GAGGIGSDIERRYRLLTVIMDSDRKLIEEAEGNLKELGEEKERLAFLDKRLRSALASARLQKAEFERTLRQRETILSATRKEKVIYLSMERELESAEKDLLSLIEKLREEGGTTLGGSGFAAMRGKLPMPVEGRIISSYGKVTNPKFNTVTFNNGVLIEASFGKPVKSVYEGKVVYVGWLKGYGEVLIIDHGGGFYTLFAHLSDVLKKRGEGVEKGEVIGLVGDSGPNNAAGLYFEVRERGVPRDPRDWIAAR
ncbi:MAG: peptidoglycan DD-metalloendopeptidase family protein, partial [Deltaproteobacteria bacterium]|nr:peptidoglycan DD-metalloendopeptidase family protein [Deltaproteobacteria bacterium]